MVEQLIHQLHRRSDLKLSAALKATGASYNKQNVITVIKNKQRLSFLCDVPLISLVNLTLWESVRGRGCSSML